MGKNQYFEFWFLILLFHCESIKKTFSKKNLGKFGDCCFEATSDSERRISKKSCYFLFIFSEIYDNIFFFATYFDNFSWNSKYISILKSVWKEKVTMLVIEIWLLWLPQRKTTNYESWNFQTQLEFICSNSTK